MKDRTIEVKDHLALVSVGDMHLVGTNFTYPDSLDTLMEPLSKAGFLVPDVSRDLEECSYLQACKLRRPASLDFFKAHRGNNVLMLLETGGYDGRVQLVEYLIDRLGLITDHPNRHLIVNMSEEMQNNLPKVNTLINDISNFSRVSKEAAFGALSYSAFLINAKKAEGEDAFKQVKKEYGFNLYKALMSMS